MRAARQKFERGELFWFDHPDGGLIFAVALDGWWEWFGDAGHLDPPGEPPDGLSKPKRGFGKIWHDHDLVDRLGWAVSLELPGEGDCKRTGDTWELWFGGDFYAKLAPPAPEPEPSPGPTPEPEPTPGPQPKPEPEDTLLRILSLIEVLLSRLVMQRIGQGDWVWLPTLDAPLNLNFVGHVHQNGTIQYGFYDTVLVLPDEDVELVREKLARRCTGGG